MTRRSMFAKLAVVVLSIGVCACVLLATRQMRIEAANDLADVRLRLMQRDNELWRVRAEIAARVTPERVREMAAGLGGMQPIVAGLYPEPREEPSEAARLSASGQEPGGPP